MQKGPCPPDNRRYFPLDCSHSLWLLVWIRIRRSPSSSREVDSKTPGGKNIVRSLRISARYLFSRRTSKRLEKTDGVGIKRVCKLIGGLDFCETICQLERFIYSCRIWIGVPKLEGEKIRVAILRCSLFNGINNFSITITCIQFLEDKIISYDRRRNRPSICNLIIHVFLRYIVINNNFIRQLTYRLH